MLTHYPGHMFSDLRCNLMPNDGPCAGQGRSSESVNYIISSNTEMWDKQQYQWREKNTVNNNNNKHGVVLIGYNLHIGKVIIIHL